MDIKKFFQKKTNTNSNNSSCYPCIILLTLYILAVIIRFTLIFIFRKGASFSIDESLYINIAKSLATGEGIAFRSQPIPYMYIFYPLLLAPLYFFPLPFDLYRLVQLFNCFLICSSVFPVYLFAKDFTQNNKKAFTASALTLFMPDMEMAGFLMSESVVWPLSLWLIFFSCRLFILRDKQLFYGVITGIITSFLFWTKPGAVTMGIVLLLASLFTREKAGHHMRRLSAFLGLVICFGMIVLFYIIYVFGFGYDLSLLGLYNKQLTPISTTWFAAVTEFSLLQLLLFAMACGSVFFIFPFAFLKQYDKNRQMFFLAFSVGLIITAIGVAALIDMFHWNESFTNPRLHLRYMAMYIPVMVVFSLGINPQEEKPSLFLSIALIIMSILTVIPGGRVGFVADTSYCVDSFALSSFLRSDIPSFPGVFLSIVTVLFLLFLNFIFLHRNIGSIQKICLVFFSFVLFCHNICGYIAGNIRIDEGSDIDAIEINAVIDLIPKDVLIITQQNYHERHSYWLESRLRKPMQQVTIDSFIQALIKGNGVYSPFVPDDEYPNIGNHSTPNTDTFLFGATIADQIEFSNSTSLQETDNGWYTLAHVPSGQRLIDTILSGTNFYFLPEDEQAQLYVFDKSRFTNGQMLLHLMAGVDEGTVSLEITNAGKTKLLPLSSNYNIQTILLEDDDIIITARGGEAVILTYWTT